MHGAEAAVRNGSGSKSLFTGRSSCAMAKQKSVRKVYYVQNNLGFSSRKVAVGQKWTLEK